ncbi:glycosyltransferase family 2 protein [Sphingomonas sp. SORGH_AS_0879]|uniref:glycosyltransferase family 2 protein n=1 Tax=Sphingomonas sp. SORGH_AS_0879 TaxID=3041790 RepID=UPI0027843D7C|nr:glycosyltransferase family 2 protein [Sphingomonas sp. SORGH_AS_0879]MDQ1230305.1 glycosyltransferase involved in cell wall biosynthesis [Sphingomonas sp. SORGH_AS_0879]
MLLDAEGAAWRNARAWADAGKTEQAAAYVAPCWTVVVPFFNEEAELAATLESLARQKVRFRLVLVDNGSLDASARVAAESCERLGLDHVLLHQGVPGKINALRLGLDHVHTRFVATCDADTLYPETYLAEAQALLEQPGCVVAGAYFIAPGDGEAERRRESATIRLAARLLPRQCHAGGAGQAFCTKALKAAGGFDPRRWNYVLEDHEVIHRVLRHGTMRYADGFWCVPSDRERDRESIRWTLAERLLYSVTAPFAGDWFFYTFLARRLTARRLTTERMREKAYQDLAGVVGEPAYSVR